MSLSNPRHRPTTTDHVLTGLTPALIMGMIICLIYFLVTILYRGDFTLRLMYILGLFTFASVLIARIAIEQTRAVSLAYALALGAATLAVVSRFVQFPDGLQFFGVLVTAGFLVLIVVLSDRITFDCTLIDEKSDSSGEGLLQSLGLIHSTVAAERQATGKGGSTQQSNAPPKRKHNPGVWVLYFALLALPLFGVGQLTIPSSDAVARSRAFWFLFGYLFFALSLLVTTSFLGMRRYLRQRDVPMPADMAFTWLAYGSGGILLLLVVGCLLPLPGRQFGLFGLPFTLKSSDLMRSSRFGWGSEGTQQNESNSQPVTQSDSDQPAGGETRADGKQPGGEVRPDGKKATNIEGESSSQGKSQQATSSDGSKSDKPQSSKTNQATGTQADPSKSEPSQNGTSEDRSKRDQPRQANDSKSEAKSSESNRQSTNRSKPSAAKSPSLFSKLHIRLPSGLDALLKLITILVLIGLILAYFVFYWRDVLNGLRNLAAWWSNLWGKDGVITNADTSTSVQVEASNPFPPFASFPDPFGMGLKGWTIDKTVRHTFSAVEAWGREHTLQRSNEETPEEYLRRLSQSFPEQQEQFQRLGSLYNRLAYAPGNLDGQQVTSLSNLWSWLRQS